jgi:undecaprenyl pyrophosphate phosphatase UppP
MIDQNYLLGIKIQNAISRADFKAGKVYMLSIVIYMGEIKSVALIAKDELNPLSDPSEGLKNEIWKTEWNGTGNFAARLIIAGLTKSLLKDRIKELIIQAVKINISLIELHEAWFAESALIKLKLLQ